MERRHGGMGARMRGTLGLLARRTVSLSGQVCQGAEEGARRVAT